MYVIQQCKYCVQYVMHILTFCRIPTKRPTNNLKQQATYMYDNFLEGKLHE